MLVDFQCSAKFSPCEILEFMCNKHLKETLKISIYFKWHLIKFRLQPTQHFFSHVHIQLVMSTTCSISERSKFNFRTLSIHTCNERLIFSNTDQLTFFRCYVFYKKCIQQKTWFLKNATLKSDFTHMILHKV